jgi:glycosyltransferase involved in cell wall biosynthesis
MKFSIITICYNPGPVVRSAVESVLGQSYPNIEYIIVDGGSTDGTLEWLKDIIDQEAKMSLVSEPDEGLYDALNKGVRLATGDVVGFVHADDYLAHRDVIQHVADRMIETGSEAVYGDLVYVAARRESGGRKVGESKIDESKVEKSNVEESLRGRDAEKSRSLDVQKSGSPEVGKLGIRSGEEVRQEDNRQQRTEDRQQGADNEVSTTDHSLFTIQNSPFNRRASIVRHWRSGDYDRKKLTWGWMPPHPTLYLNREVYQRAILANGEYFDTSFSCAADYDFMMRVFSKHNVQPVYLPEVLVKMRVGGVSNRSLKHILRKSAEDWRAIRRNKIGHLHTLVWKNLSKISQFLRKSQ